MDKWMKEKLKEGGIKWEGGTLFYNNDRICNFIPIVTCRYHEGGKYKYQLVICVGEGENAFIRTASLDDIGNGEFWGKISDDCMIFPGVLNRKLLGVMKYIIKVQIDKGVPERQMISQLGWNKSGGTTCYCTGDALHPQPDNSEIEISEELSSEFKVASNNSRNSIEIFNSLKKMLSFGNPVVTAYGLCNIVAILYTVFKWCKIYIEFSVLLIGRTSTFKTTLAKYIGHMYGSDRNIGGMMVELCATEKQIEKVMEKCKDCSFIVDDLAPALTKKATLEKSETVARLIRKATSSADMVECHGNQISRNHVSGILVFTAEKNIAIPSIINRVIFLDVDKFPIGKNMLQFMEQNPGFPVELSLLIIEDVARDIEEYERFIKEKYAQHMKEESVDVKYSRFRKNYVCLQTAWDVIQKVAKERGIDLYEDVSVMVQDTMNEAMSHHANILKQLEFQGDQYAPVKLLFDALLNADQRDIFEMSKEDEIEYEKKGKNFYIQPENAILYLLRKNGQEYSVKKLGMLLQITGALQKDKSGAATKKYHNKRCWVLDKKEMKEFLRERG